MYCFSYEHIKPFLITLHTFLGEISIFIADLTLEYFFFPSNVDHLRIITQEGESLLAGFNGKIDE